MLEINDIKCVAIYNSMHVKDVPVFCFTLKTFVFVALGVDKDVDCALVLVLRHQLQRHLVEPFHFEDEKADAASHELSQVERGDIF